MAMIAVQCMVADYAKFRPVFEKGAARRAAAGITNPRVYRNADNGNDVLVVGDVANVAKAREALGSPEYRRNPGRWSRWCAEGPRHRVALIHPW